MNSQRVASGFPSVPPSLGRSGRGGFTLVEVIVALSLMGGVLFGLGMFSVRMAQSTSSARVRVTLTQLAADRLEAAKGAPRYTAVESLFVATEAMMTGYPGYTRQTWVSHVGGAVTDTMDYKVITVQVSNNQIGGNVRKSTVIAPF